jgi:prepilin-type N-terminal cleavage/methylation domain-containing protein
VDARDDAGLTLVELLVAIVLFGLASTGIAYGLVTSTKSVRDNRMRVQAANLAARELEIARNDFAQPDGPETLGASSVTMNPHPLPGGVADQPLDIDGAKFTVLRSVQWLPNGAGASPCDGGSLVTYPSLAVHVRVTWNQMGLTKPVVSNTILTPPKGTLDNTMSFVAVKVQGADGKGVGLLPVTLAGPVGTQVRDTATDGCAVFALTVPPAPAAPGTYTASVGEPGYVTFDGLPSATRSTTVLPGKLNQVPLISYDKAATFHTHMQTLPGHVLPSPQPWLTFFQPNLPSPFTKKLPTASVDTIVGGLWPFTTGYSVWAGGCDQSDPSKAGGARPASIPLTPGADETINVGLAPVAVHVVDSLGVPVPGVVVKATPTSTVNCMTGENSLTLGTADAAGELKTSLPAGAYTLTVVGRSPDDGTWAVTPSSLPLDAVTDQTVGVL